MKYEVTLVTGGQADWNKRVSATLYGANFGVSFSNIRLNLDGVCVNPRSDLKELGCIPNAQWLQLFPT